MTSIAAVTGGAGEHVIINPERHELTAYEDSVVLLAVVVGRT